MLGRLRPYILLFAALTAIYHANLRPVDSSDSLPAALIPFAVVLDHTVTLDRFAPWLHGHVWYTASIIHQAHGHFFSSYPIGGALLVTPLYLPAGLLVRHWDAGSLAVLARIAEKFAAAAVAALSAVLVLLLLKRITTTGWAWCLTFVYALATETWSISSQALWQHGPAELAIIGTLLCLDYWTEHRTSSVALGMCGVCTAAAFIFRPTSLVLLPAMVAAFWFAKATLAQHIRFLAAPVVGGVLLAGYNLYVFHRASGGYAVALLTGSTWAGLAGVFLSPGRGLLMYTPVALFALCAFSRRASSVRNKHNPVLTAAVAFILLDSIAIARSVNWWGGYCWGPRLLTELIPPLMVLMAVGASAIDRPWVRSAFAICALYSMLIQAVGVFFYPNGHWDGIPEGVDELHGRLWNWRDNPIDRTVRGGFYWEPYAIVGAVFTGGISAAETRMRELNVNPYEQAQPGKLPGTDRGLP